MIEAIAIAFVAVAAVAAIMFRIERQLDDSQAHVRVLELRDARRQVWLDEACSLLCSLSLGEQDPPFLMGVSMFLDRVQKHPDGIPLDADPVQMAGQVRMERHRHSIGIGAIP